MHALAPAAATAASAPRPRLLDLVRSKILVKGNSPRTATTYVAWIRRYVLFHGKQHPGDLDNEHVTDVTLYGRGFSPRGNLVRFGDREIPGLMSENAGTLIRFPAPVLRVREGRVQVRVVRDGVESNAVSFLVKGDKR